MHTIRLTGHLLNFNCTHAQSWWCKTSLGVFNMLTVLFHKLELSIGFLGANELCQPVNHLSWEIDMLHSTFPSEVVKSRELNSPKMEVSRPTPRLSQDPRDHYFQVQRVSRPTTVLAFTSFLFPYDLPCVYHQYGHRITTIFPWPFVSLNLRVWMVVEKYMQYNVYSCWVYTYLWTTGPEGLFNLPSIIEVRKHSRAVLAIACLELEIDAYSMYKISTY